MSNLPKYSREADEEVETAPLFKGDLDRSSLDLEAQVPAYPPRLGESSTAAGEDQRGAVTYTFVPRYPIKGDKEDAIGVMGRTKEEAIAIVKSGFSRLADYPPERIEFLAPVAMNRDGSVVDNRWGVIMEEAWPAFAKTPPAHLKVQVKDGPGDAEARDKHETQVLCSVLGGLVALGLTVTFIIWLCGGMEPSAPHKVLGSGGKS